MARTAPLDEQKASTRKCWPATVQEFIAYAKANPARLNFGSAGLATITHHAGEIFNIEADVKMVHVALYKGSAPATNDSAVRPDPVQFDPTTLPHIAAGRTEVLRRARRERWPGQAGRADPEEQGLGKIGGDAWYGILAAMGVAAGLAIDEKMARRSARRSRTRR